MYCIKMTKAQHETTILRKIPLIQLKTINHIYRSIYSCLKKSIKNVSVNIRMLSFREHEHTQTHMAISQNQLQPKIRTCANSRFVFWILIFRVNIRKFKKHLLSPFNVQNLARNVDD